MSVGFRINVGYGSTDDLDVLLPLRVRKEGSGTTISVKDGAGITLDAGKISVNPFIKFSC